MSLVANRNSTINFRAATQSGARKGYGTAVEVVDGYVELSFDTFKTTFTVAQCAEVAKNLGRANVALREAASDGRAQGPTRLDVAGLELWNLLVSLGLGQHPSRSPMVIFCNTQMGILFSAAGDFVEPRPGNDAGADAAYPITISLNLDDKHTLLQIGHRVWRLDFAEAKWLVEHMSIAASLAAQPRVSLDRHGGDRARTSPGSQS
jgi:hypothetical protein